MENKLIELGIIPEILENGVEMISLVEMPAIETDFMYFNKVEGKETIKYEFKLQNEEKRIVVGPAMIPAMNILRKNDKTGDTYNVVFSEETILESMKKFMKESRTNSTDIHHSGDSAKSYVYESWIVEDPTRDKANLLYGFNVPKGTWMVAMQIEDTGIWNRVKSGELRGFSIEGFFSDMEEITAMKNYLKIVKILNN